MKEQIRLSMRTMALIVIAIASISLCKLHAQGVNTGWFEPSAVATPTTGDDSQWLTAAVGSEAPIDNARLLATIVYDPFSNTTFGTYMGGSDDNTAGIYVLSFNHTTQTQTEARRIYTFSEVEDSRFDGHSYPTIVRSLDGHIHVFFCDQRGGHRNIQMRFSERGTVESDYTTNTLLVGGNGLMGRPGTSSLRAEYPKPFVARNGDMYFFSRLIPYGDHEMTHEHGGEEFRVALRPQVYLKSTDNGGTWSPAKIGIMRENNVDYLTEPYLNQVIPEPAREGVEERIHFTWTLAAGIGLWYNNSGELEYNYHNAHAQNVYHAYFVPGEDVFYSMDGTMLGESIHNEEMDWHCLVEKTLENVYELPMSYEQYQEVRASNTGIMGHFTTIDDKGNVYVNGKNYWNGQEWVSISADFHTDTRLIDWRNGKFNAYYGFGFAESDDISGNWTTVGSIDMSGTVVEDRLGNIGQKKGCPPARLSHPEAMLWVKAYPPAASRYGGFVVLGGHRTSYEPARVYIEVERGKAVVGSQVKINAFVLDENGARILDAVNHLSFTSEIGTFSETETNANQGLGKSVMTIDHGVAFGEYEINVSSPGLESGTTYLTINDIVASFSKLATSPGEKRVVAYPNPVSDHLFVNADEEFHVRIIDLSGKVVFNEKRPNGSSQINIDLNAGMYILDIQIHSQERIIQQLVVQ